MGVQRCGALADVDFAGEAPGYTGLLQINARVPRWLPQAQLSPVVLRVGTASSQAGVTIAVR
jgi:uncharacterized protein (TIGR03437 family)